MPTGAVADPGLAMSRGMDFPPVAISDSDGCHPHLFLRTEAVSRRLNRHLYKFLGRIDALLAQNPISTSGGQEVWDHTWPSGLEAQFTVTKTGATTYTWELDVRAAAADPFTKVFSGTIDMANATGPHQGAGTASLDLTALHTVIPAEPATGTIQVTFDVTAAKRQVALDAANVAWDTDGDPDDLPPVAPRTAHYVYLSEKGIGGSLKAADQMIFFCPIANPGLARADVDLVHRWYRLADGSLHGRADALMTNGQLPAGEQVVGVTCHARPAPPAPPAPKTGGTTPGTGTTTAADMAEPPDAEGYWQVNLEQGTTLMSSQSAGTTTACDPLLGAIPVAGSTSGDFNFTAVTFTDGMPYPFPNMQ
jgi:hypothetical protein